MSFDFTWKRALIALGLYGARRPIIATGHRAMQYATAYTVRGLLLLLVVVFITLAFALGFSWNEMHAAVFVTAIVFTILYVCIAALPFCSVPGSLLAGSTKKYFARACIGLVFILAFFLYLYIVPIGKSPAITFGMLLLLMIALAALATGHVHSDLDDLIGKKIWGLVWIGVALGTVGLFYLTLPTSKTDAVKEKTVAVSKSIADARGANQEGYILAIIECRASTNNFTQKQLTAYAKGCGADVAVKGLTREEVQIYWPDFFVSKSLAGTTAGNESTTSPAKTSQSPSFMADPMGWLTRYWQALLAMGTGMVVLHVLFLVAAPVAGFLGIKSLTKKDTDKKTTTTTSSAGTVVLWLLGIVAVLGVLAYIGGYRLDQPAPIADTRGAAILPGQCGEWVATYRDVNGHSVNQIPQDAWHGKVVPIFPSQTCQVTELIDLVLVFDQTNPDLNISLSGTCRLIGGGGLRKECTGTWRSGQRSGDSFRLEWERDWRTFGVSLYFGQFPKEGPAMKQIRFTLNHG